MQLYKRRSTKKTGDNKILEREKTKNKKTGNKIKKTQNRQKRF